MSLRGQGPRNRRARRAGTGAVAPIKSSAVDLPGPLKFLGNPRLFMVFAALAGAAMIVGLAAGALGSGTTPTDGPMQANEAPDVPIDNTTQTPGTTTTDAQPNVQRYTEPPALSIDTSKTYKATLQTPKGPITIELYPSAAPEAVNAFVFLANEGYYN
ncbi:MAG TPA: peptidylprolyl isomerase, partial [Dehalococcoidia bacterium]|nr:peptidylprolyl isomerase [Dehalococcoidia bacterium]